MKERGVRMREDHGAGPITYGAYPAKRIKTLFYGAPSHRCKV